MKRRVWVSDPMLTALSANILYVIGKYNVDSARAGVIAWHAMRVGYTLFEEPSAPNFKVLKYVIERLTEIQK